MRAFVTLSTSFAPVREGQQARFYIVVVVEGVSPLETMQSDVNCIYIMVFLLHLDWFKIRVLRILCLTQGLMRATSSKPSRSKIDRV